MKHITKHSLLSSLWIFAMFCYLYADLLSLMDKTTLGNYIQGAIGSIIIDQSFLFFAAILMLTAIMMVLFSRILPRTPNRILNIIFGVIHTIVVIGSNFAVNVPTGFYILYSIVESIATLSIVIIAIRWSAKRAEE